MKKYFYLTSKMLLHTRLYWLLIFAIGFGVLMPCVQNDISKILSSAAYNEQLDTFGRFQYIAYIVDKNNEVPEIGQNFSAVIFPDKDIEQSGYIYKLGLGDIDGLTIDIGYLDQVAWGLSSAELLSGRLPEKRGEIALADTKLYELSSGKEYKIGDSLNISGRDFELTGIYAEFGTRWTGGENYRSYREIEGLFCYDDAADLWNNSGIKMITILMSGTAIFDDIELQDEEYVFHNIYIDDSYGKNMYELPPFLLPIVSIICSLFIISIYLLICRERKDVYALYCKLGFTNRDIKLLQLFILTICNFIGLGAALLGRVICLNLIPYFVSAGAGDSSYAADYSMISTLAGIQLIVLILCFIINIFVEKDRQPSVRKKSFRVISYICTKFYVVFIAVSSLMILVAYHITTLYQYNYEDSNITLMKGEMNEIQGLDYDFELIAVDTESTDPDLNMSINYFPEDGSGIYVYSNKMYYGMTDHDFDEMSSLTGVEKVKLYKENDSIMLHIKNDKTNDYIDASDFIPDGVYDPKTFHQWDEFIYETFGLQGQLVVNSKLLGCANDDLTALSDYLLEGTVNHDKIKMGEEIVLIVPPFKLIDFGEGTILMQKLRPGEMIEPDYYVDETYSVGDTVEFYSMQPHNTELSYGSLPGSLVRDEFDLVKCNAKVGAIIYDYVGWFTNANSPRAYTIVTHNDAFQSFGLKEKYSRMRIYAEQNAAEAEITRLVYHKYRNMQTYTNIYNRMRESRVHKDYIDFISVIRTLTIAVFGFIAVCVLSTYIMIQIIANRKKIGLFFICGLSVKALVLDFIKLNLSLWIVNMLMFMIALHFIVQKLFHTSISFSFMKLGGSIIVLLAIQLIPIVPCIIYLKKHSVNELIN